MGRVGTSLGKRLDGFVNSFVNRKSGEIVRGLLDFLYAGFDGPCNVMCLYAIRCSRLDGGSQCPKRVPLRGR